MIDRGAFSSTRFAVLRSVGALALALGVLAAPMVAAAQSDGDEADGASADVGAVRLPVAPLMATINAAAFQPMPQGAAFVIQRYDDSREHEAIAAALSEAIGRLGGRGATPMPLDLTFDVYVIRSGVPVLAKGLLETGDRRSGRFDAPTDGRPPGIDVTDLRGRGQAAEGNVFHLRDDSFAATLRLKITVSDPMTGAYLWRGWADSSMNGLSRAQVASLLADPLLSTMGRTVADQSVRLAVPAAMGGAPRDEEGR